MLHDIIYHRLTYFNSMLYHIIILIILYHNISIYLRSDSQDISVEIPYNKHMSLGNRLVQTFYEK